jgi:hypothetical protein
MIPDRSARCGCSFVGFGGCRGPSKVRCETAEMRLKRRPRMPCGLLRHGLRWCPDADHRFMTSGRFRCEGLPKSPRALTGRVRRAQDLHRQLGRDVARSRALAVDSKTSRRTQARRNDPFRDHELRLGLLFLALASEEPNLRDAVYAKVAILAEFDPIARLWLSPPGTG